MRKLLSKFDNLRHWVDGEDDASAFPAVTNVQLPARRSQEFLFKVTREICTAIEQEAFTPPGGPTFIPPEIIAFLSEEDDRNWRGMKRRTLERWIASAVSQRIAELFRGKKLAARQAAVRLLTDGTLESGEVRIKPVWDPDGTKTIVKARTPNDPFQAVAQSDFDEKTVVVNRPRLFYSIEVFRGGVRQAIFPVTKPKISIGRGSQAVEVDLKISGDAEVSRLHITLERESEDAIWMTAKGQNPVYVKGCEVNMEARFRIVIPDEIKVGSYLLRLH